MNHRVKVTPSQTDSLLWDTGTKGARCFAEDPSARLDLISISWHQPMPLVSHLFEIAATSEKLPDYITGSPANLNPFWTSEHGEGNKWGSKAGVVRKASLTEDGHNWRESLRKRTTVEWVRIFTV